MDWCSANKHDPSFNFNTIQIRQAWYVLFTDSRLNYIPRIGRSIQGLHCELIATTMIFAEQALTWYNPKPTYAKIGRPKSKYRKYSWVCVCGGGGRANIQMVKLLWNTFHSQHVLRIQKMYSNEATTYNFIVTARNVCCFHGIIERHINGSMEMTHLTWCAQFFLWNIMRRRRILRYWRVETKIQPLTFWAITRKR